METLIVGLATALVTAFGAWLMHKRETQKEKTVGRIATAALHTELDTRMKSHVHFVEERMLAERRWFNEELERERDECAEQIDRLAGRLGIAEARLRKLRGTEGTGE